MTETQPPAAPVITSATYDPATAPAAITVTGTSTVMGTVTVYDGEAAVATTTTLQDDDNSWSVVLTSVAPGDHMLSACVTTGPDHLTSEWATPSTVTV